MMVINAQQNNCWYNSKLKSLHWTVKKMLLRKTNKLIFLLDIFHSFFYFSFSVFNVFYFVKSIKFIYVNFVTTKFGTMSKIYTHWPHGMSFICPSLKFDLAWFLLSCFYLFYFSFVCEVPKQSCSQLKHKIQFSQP